MRGVALRASGLDPGRRRELRRVAIGVFFGSVVVNAALGLSALVVGDFSETHGRILGTSLLVTAGLLGAIACAPARERGRLGPVPLVGMAACAATVALGSASIWSGGEGELLGKAVGTAATLAGGSILASLLAYPRLEQRFRLVLVVALALVVAAVVMANIAFWAEVDSSLYARAFGAVCVLLAAFAVSVPVLARVGRGAAEHAAAAVVAFCPFCGASVSAVGEAAGCTRCHRSFSVRLDSTESGSQT